MSATVRLLTLGAATAVLLSACASTVPEQIVDAKTPTEQFVAKVDPVPSEVQLAVHAQGVSANQAAALAALVADWRAAEGDDITIQAPSGGPDPAATFRTGDTARAVLISRGVPPENIRMVGYDAKGAVTAPLLVGFLRYHAAVPKCGEAWTNLARSATNKVSPNFGCAVTANMAAQIANPADLLGPREMTPADANRREVVLGKYRKGELTASVRDDQAKGTVSEVVK